MVSPGKTAAPGENSRRQTDGAPSLWSAKWIGARAKSLLDAPGFSGQVSAVLSESAYLSGGEGEILWLVREGAPRHRRGIPLSFPPLSLRAGQGFFRADNCLIVRGGPAVDLSQAVEWKPQALDPAEIVPLARVGDNIRQLLASLSPTIPDEGPGLVILGLASLLKGGEVLACKNAAWQDRLLSPLLDLMKHCLQGGWPTSAPGGKN